MSLALGPGSFQALGHSTLSWSMDSVSAGEHSTCFAGCFPGGNDVSGVPTAGEWNRRLRLDLRELDVVTGKRACDNGKTTQLSAPWYGIQKRGLRHAQSQAPERTEKRGPA